MAPGARSITYTGETGAWDVDFTNPDFDQQADQAHVVDIANNMLDCIQLCGYGIDDIENMSISIHNNMTTGCGPMWFSYVGPITSLILAIKQVGLHVDCWQPIDLSNNMIRTVCELKK